MCGSTHVTINGNFQLRKCTLFFVSAGTHFLLLFVIPFPGDHHSKLFSFSNGNTLILKITLLAFVLGNAQLLVLSLSLRCAERRQLSGASAPCAGHGSKRPDAGRAQTRVLLCAVLVITAEKPFSRVPSELAH